MAKMVANKYYTKGGVEKINGYFVSISKKIIEEAEFDVDAQIKIRTEKGKIIIEENEEN